MLPSGTRSGDAVVELKSRNMAASGGVGALRLKKELKMLYEDPPPGISAWAQEENVHELDAGAFAP